MNVAYNMDCLEAMRKMPDNAFDLAVVDPPYGSGLTETGGCKGWFAKYHQDGPDNLGGGWNRFGQRFDRYKHEQSTTCTAVVESTKENERKGGGRTTPSGSGSHRRITRTGGQWAAKYQKNHFVGHSPETGIF